MTTFRKKLGLGFMGLGLNMVGWGLAAMGARSWSAVVFVLGIGCSSSLLVWLWRTR